MPTVSAHSAGRGRARVTYRQINAPDNVWTASAALTRTAERSPAPVSNIQAMHPSSRITDSKEAAPEARLPQAGFGAVLTAQG